MKNFLANYGGWWARQSDKQKKLYATIGAGGVIILIAAIASTTADNKVRTLKPDTPVETQLMIPNKPRLELDQITAELVALRGKMQNIEQAQKTSNDRVMNEIQHEREAATKERLQPSEDQAKIRELEEKILQLQANNAVTPPSMNKNGLNMVAPAARSANGPGLSSSLPVPNKVVGASPNGGIPQMAPDGGVDSPEELKSKEPKKPMFRIIDGQNPSGNEQKKSDVQNANLASTPISSASSSASVASPGQSKATGALGNMASAEVGSSGIKSAATSSGDIFARVGGSGAGGGKESWLPAGSIIKGVVLNGMDAPTSGAALKNPTPTLIRIKHEAILPNYWQYDVRECFIIGSGHGVMSTERVILRTEKISCVKANGTAIESKLEGYAIGEDGKVGVRGRLVTKQGALVARSLMAGFLSGISKGLAPTSVFNYAPNTTGTTQTTQPDVSTMLQNAAMTGVGESLNQVSKFWLDMAKEMFPVVELDAGRPIEIVLVNGVSLKLK